MATALNLFPARVRFTNADGTLTPEAYRALRLLFERVGGALGDNGTDVFAAFGGGDADNLMGEVSARETVMQAQTSDDCCQFSDLLQVVGNEMLPPDVSQAVNPDRFFSDVVQPISESTGFDLAATTHAATSKSTPVDADELPIADSNSGFTLKKLTWANLKATLSSWIGGGTIPAAFTTLSTTENASFAKNLGIGVSPSDWNTDYKAVQMGSTAAIYGRVGTPQAGVTNNAYRDSGGTWRYLTTGAAMRIEMDSGIYSWLTAASGSAGDPISFTEQMNLSASGLAISQSASIGVFTIATRPAHSAGKLIYVSDGGSGANFQGSTGSAWVNLG